MSSKFEDELWNMVDACIDHSEYIEKLKALLKEHINVHSIRGGNYPVYTLTIELGEFLDD